VALRFVGNADDKPFVNEQNAGLVCSIMQRTHADAIKKLVHRPAGASRPGCDKSCKIAARMLIGPMADATTRGAEPRRLPSLKEACHSISTGFIFFSPPKHKLPKFMRPTGRKKFILMQPGSLGREALATHKIGQN